MTTHYEVRVFDSKNTSIKIDLAAQPTTKDARDVAKATANGYRERNGLKIDKYIVQERGTIGGNWEAFLNGTLEAWSFPNGLEGREDTCAACDTGLEGIHQH